MGPEILFQVYDFKLLSGSDIFTSNFAYVNGISIVMSGPKSTTGGLLGTIAIGAGGGDDGLLQSVCSITIDASINNREKFEIFMLVFIMSENLSHYSPKRSLVVEY